MTENILAKYLRISKDDGRCGNSQSIENQRALIDDYIRSKPDLNSCTVLEFVDDGLTGVNFNRPAAEKMLDMAKKGGISCIIVKDFSRFGRDYIDVGDYLEQIFPFLGIRFVSVNDGYDSAIHGSLAGDIGNGFKNLYNSYYSKDLSRKIRTGLLARKESGAYTPSRCFYGYRKPDCGNNGQIGMEVDEPAAVIVQRIFKMKLDGCNCTVIARVLNGEKIPSPLVYQANSGNMKIAAKYENLFWTNANVTRILHDIRYTGVFAYNMYKKIKLGGNATIELPREQWTLVPGAIPSIISQEVFEQAQPTNTPKKATHSGIEKRPLAGKLLCGGCGHTLKLSPRKTRCSCRRRAFTGNNDCVGGSVDIKQIENILCGAIQKLFDVYHEINSSKTKSKNKAKNGIPREIIEFQARIRATESQKISLYDQYCDGGLSREEYVMQHEVEERSFQELRGKLSVLEQQQMKSLPKVSLDEVMNNLTFNGKLTREVVDALIDKVLVHSGERLEIKWKFNDSMIQTQWDIK